MVPAIGRLLRRFAFVRRGECCVVMDDCIVAVQEKNICVPLTGREAHPLMTGFFRTVEGKFARRSILFVKIRIEMLAERFFRFFR